MPLMSEATKPVPAKPSPGKRVLKAGLIVAGLLVAAFAAMAGIGATIPQGHVASARVPLSAPPETIWAIVHDFETWPEWQPGVHRIERLPDRDGKPVWVQSTDHGELPIAVEKSEPPWLLRTRIADPELPFGGTWTWRIEADGEGSVVTLTEDGEIKSAVFRFFAHHVFGYHATMEAYLAALAKKLGDARAEVERTAVQFPPKD